MPIFEYVALNSTGKSVKGSLDADSVRVARQRLRAQGYYPTELKEGAARPQASTRDVRKMFQTNRVSVKNLAIITRQLATLVGSGIPLVGSLGALSEQIESMMVKRIIIDVKEQVEEGSALAKALGRFPKSFPRLYVNMIAAGEASGTLDAVLENLADYLEAQVELRRKIGSSLFYPALMLVFCVLVIVGLLAFVVPNIVEIFQKQNAVLPLPTRVMITISDALVNYWPMMLLALLLCGVGFRWYYRQPFGRSRVDALVLKLPLVGSLYRRVCAARVARTLGTLLASGVGLLVALDIVKNIVNNVHVARTIEDARDGVREGRSLAKELGKTGIFPPLLAHMIAVGEKSGKLEGMLAKAARAYENEVNAALSGLTSLIEPLMIIGLGGIVFSIVLSILTPMADLVNIVQG